MSQEFFKSMDNGSWHRVVCPCGAINWIYASDDCCAAPIEKIKCHKCEKSYWFDEVFWTRMEGAPLEDDEDEIYTEEGKATPS